MAMKPEAVLQLLADGRGGAICVHTMTNAPAWRTIGPDDLAVQCIGFMGGASSPGLGVALARPDRRVFVLDRLVQSSKPKPRESGSLSGVAPNRAANPANLDSAGGAHVRPS